MSYVLVKFNADWADEFDVCGFTIYETDKWNKVVEDFKKAKSYCGWYFGTNEGFLEEEVADNWLDNYTVTDITYDEFLVFKRHFCPFGKRIYYGDFKCPSELIDEHA